MLEWLKSNAVTILVSILGAGGWLGFILNRCHENRKDQKQILKELNNEVEALGEELKRYKLLETNEESIDKSRGTIYVESLRNGGKREICGYCWEKDHIKIPVISSLEYDERTGGEEYWASCQNCKKSCTYFTDVNSGDGELPF